MVCYSILFGSLIPAVSNRGSTQPSPCHVRRRSRKDPTPSSTQCDFLTFLGASGHKLGGLSVQQEELVQETSRNHIFFPLNHPSGFPLFLKLFLKLCVKHPKLLCPSNFGKFWLLQVRFHTKSLGWKEKARGSVISCTWSSFWIFKLVPKFSAKMFTQILSTYTL